ncbi:MAG: hypothetical protein LLG20_03430 [Acidobacteriales bacterium]|nr:hypothetical protein [Terriglobales bacterium]
MTLKTLFATLLLDVAAWSATGSSMIVYSAQPNAYFDDHAADIKKFADGFFFVLGDWSDASKRLAPANNPWLDTLRKNIASLRKAGVSENLLGVYFGGEGPWPSEQTLLGDAGLAKLREEFATLGRTAKSLGFRGVSIDMEYAERRYELVHPSWKYNGYTTEDLTRAAYRNGEAAIASVLDEFPGAVVAVLPGDLHHFRPLGREFMRGVFAEMARRDASGGLHLASEYTYCLGDPLSTLATARLEDPLVAKIATTRQASYWKRRCTVAPGVWPFHMVETGGKDYPVQPWKKEIAELREQMALIRAVAKRYVWTFTSNPIWYIHSPEIEAKYGLRKQDLKREDIGIRDWRKVMAERAAPPAKWLGTIENIRRYDRGELSPDQLCDAFGTPGRWWVLGLLAAPRKSPQFAAVDAAAAPIDPETAHHGRDGVLHWFPISLYDPRGIVNCQYVFDWRGTDSSGAHFATYVHSATARRATLHIGWDDVITVRWNDRIVFDTREDAKQVKGLLYLDKYRFEKQVPIELKAGRNKLVLTSTNDHGVWALDFRITSEDGVPLPGVRFRLE